MPLTERVSMEEERGAGEGEDIDEFCFKYVAFRNLREKTSKYIVGNWIYWVAYANLRIFNK